MRVTSPTWIKETSYNLSVNINNSSKPKPDIRYFGLDNLTELRRIDIWLHGNRPNPLHLFFVPQITLVVSGYGITLECGLYSFGVLRAVADVELLRGREGGPAEAAAGTQFIRRRRLSNSNDLHLLVTPLECAVE